MKFILKTIDLLLIYGLTASLYFHNTESAYLAALGIVILGTVLWASAVKEDMPGG